VQKQIKFLGFMSGVKPKVSKLLRRHLNGESDDKEEVAPIVGACWKDIWSHGASPHGSNILRMVQGSQETVVTAFKWLVGPPGPRGCGSPGAGLCGWAVSKTGTKNRLKPNRGKGIPLYHLSSRDIRKGGGGVEIPETPKGETTKGAQ
jgi:hypothetical protein